MTESVTVLAIIFLSGMTGTAIGAFLGAALASRRTNSGI